MDKEKRQIVAVIGGGPAGLMAAGVAAELGASVLLFETKLKCGNKLLLTGAGKCNITNHAPLDEFLEYYPENRKFLYPAFKYFFKDELEQFFNRYNVFFRYEENGKIFPENDKTESVLDALIAYCHETQVEIHLSEPVKEINVLDDEDGLQSNSRWEIVAEKDVYLVNCVIVATGGLSYPGTGSTGSGYLMAESLSITVTPTRPALVPLVIKEQWCAELTGVSLQEVKTSLWESGDDGIFRKVISMTEDILFTHFGVSGPAALFISRWIKSKSAHYRLTIDLAPMKSSNDIENLLLESFSQSPNKLLRTIISKDLNLPHAVSAVLVRLCAPDDKIYCRDTTRVIRKKLVSTIKSLPLTVLKTKGYSEAMVTAGGVSTREIDPQTMESKFHPGLYFAGEVIDIDGFTGGFNLQAAFSTGYLAGRSASKKCLHHLLKS